MQGKIAVEEHFRIAETTGSEGRYPGPYWAGLSAKLLDLHDVRLAEMDKTGIEIEVISLNSNAIQGIPDPAKAVEMARKANDALAEAVAKRPDRFAALGALPMQDPQAAADELAALRARSQIQGRAGERLFASRLGRHRGLLRPAAIPAVLGRGGAAWRAVLPASARSIAEPAPGL